MKNWLTSAVTSRATDNQAVRRRKCHLKKGRRFADVASAILSSSSVRYQFIEQNRGPFTSAVTSRITAMCRILEVSPSGYYSWRHRPESSRSPLRLSGQNRDLLDEIQAVYADSDQRYGSPQRRTRRCIYIELPPFHGGKEKGISCSENRADPRPHSARLMHQNGIRALAPRRFIVTTDSKLWTGHGAAHGSGPYCR
jgi:hypothetical protein